MKTLVLAILFISLSAWSLEVPRLTGPVVDQANILTPSQERAIGNLLVNLKRDTTHQVQVLLVDSLEGESIEGYSIRVTDQWKLGDEAKDNGVLFLVSMRDRKMRIEVGQGLEGDLTDLESSYVLDSVKPFFRKKQFARGVLVGLQGIAVQIGGDLTQYNKQLGKISKRRSSKSSGAINLFIFLFILFVFLPLRYKFGFIGGRRGSYYSSTGTGGWHSSGGSSWGGGGGGFSGGGSSSNW